MALGLRPSVRAGLAALQRQRATATAEEGGQDLTADSAAVTADTTARTADGGSGIDETLEIRSTQRKYLDLRSYLSALAKTTQITATLTGTVAIHLRPDLVLTGGSSGTYYPQQFLNDPHIVTSGAAEGTGVGSLLLTWAGGSCAVSFDVSDAAPTTWTIGKDNNAQFGGFPIHEYLSGTPGDWSITSQSTANAFTIVNADNATAALATKRWVAWAGTYGSSTRTVGTPSTGAAAYSVTLTNSSTSATHTISWTVTEGEWNAAPNALNDTTNVSQLATIHARLDLSAGDTVIMEKGIHNPSQLAMTVTPNPTGNVRPTRGGSFPALPTSPYGTAATGICATGYEPDGYTFHAGWITTRPRNPREASLPRFRIGAANCNSLYLRFSWIDNLDLTFVSPTATGLGVHWLMIDRCVMEGSVGLNPFESLGDAGGTYNSNLFAVCNNLTAGAVTVYGQDSQAVGNYGYEIPNTSDFMQLAIYNSNPASIKAIAAWNFLNGCPYASGAAHMDFLQEFNNGTVGPYRDTLAAATEVTAAYVFGNVGVRGNVTDQADGDAEITFQFIFHSDRRTDLVHHDHVSGNLCVTNVIQGTVLVAYSATSVVRNNTYVANPAPNVAGTGNPTVRVESSAESLIIKHCAVASPTFTAVSGAPAPTGTNNRQDIRSGGTISPADAWVSPNEGRGVTTLREVLEAYAPKPGGPLTTGNGSPAATQVIGAIGTGLINHEAWYYDAANLFA